MHATIFLIDYKKKIQHSEGPNIGHPDSRFKDSRSQLLGTTTQHGLQRVPDGSLM